MFLHMNTLGVGLGALGGCSGSPLSQQDVYALARNAGFSPDIARSMVAIAMRESSLIPNCYAGSVAGSTEASYGLWQINMGGALGVARMLQFGLTDASQLLDPATNAKAAYRLSGGSNLSPWHIDSDTATINGKLVDLGYRTKYIANLSRLPSTDELESTYDPNSVPSASTTTSSDLPSTNAPDISNTSFDPTTLLSNAMSGDAMSVVIVGGVVALGAWLLLSRR